MSTVPPAVSTEPAVEFHDAKRKAMSMLMARAALASFSLRRLDIEETGSVYLISRWKLPNEPRTIDDVAWWLERATSVQRHHDPGRHERDRRVLINEDNRRQDLLDEATDLLRGPGGEK